MSHRRGPRCVPSKELAEGDHATALPESALSELLDALRNGDGVDLIRDAVRLVMQELIETEATAVIGAEPYERTPARANERNGHRDRLLSTKAGDVELRIPKLRRGSFFPSILEPRRRIDQALYAVVMTAYVQGVSTRAADDLVAALGVDTGISKSEVSRICKRLDEHVDAFRNRTLGHIAFPYMYLDATYVNVRVRRRGLAGVSLVISDAHEGFKAAIRKHFTGRRGKGAGCTSPATSCSASRRAIRTWSPPRSGWCSCTPTRPPSRPGRTTRQGSSRNSSPGSRSS